MTGQPGGAGELAPEDREALVEVLEEGRRRGLLGPGPIAPQIHHALAFGAAMGPAPARALDLGTGGGIPGLVLALAWPGSRWTLLDSRARSAEFVTEAASRLGLDGRVGAVLDRAETVGRIPAHRGSYDLVVARGFGGPAVTAECAAPLLVVGGRLVVSEPPGSQGARWPAGPLDELGLRLVGTVSVQQASFAVFAQVQPCPERYPRRVGQPAKRPLFPAGRDPDVSRETDPGT